MEIKKLDNSQLEAKFEVSHELFLEGLDKAFEIQNAKVTIQGFRKGKAPKKIYLQHYGEESLYEEALNYVVSKKMQDELYSNKEIAVLSQPELDVNFEDLNKEEGFTFTLKFDTTPEFKLPKYKGIEVKKLSNEVSKEEVEAEKNRLLKNEIVKEDKMEGNLEKGDIAIFDFLGTKDGVPFEGGEAKDYELKIGSGQFIPGFEDGMIGMAKDEEKDIKVTFPEDYFEESLKGQPVNFHVTLHQIKKEVMPELTPELFQKLNLEVKDADEFDIYVSESLKLRKENANQNQINNEVLNKLLDSVDFDLPNGLVEERINYMVKQLEAQANQYQIPLDMFLQFQGTTLEQYKENAKEYAKRQVKMEFILDKIAEEEKLTPNKEELDKYIEQYGKAEGKSLEDMIKQYGYQAFFSSFILEKAQAVVIDNKVVVE